MDKLFSYISSFTKEETARTAVNRMEIYRDFLLEKNAQFNLTAITDPDEIEEKHFIDSIAAFPFVHGSVADIGSGAGFPAVPLKILLPDHSFTLIDSLRKRVDFLTELIERLQLDNIRALHSRAEDLPKDVLYDTVVARAVSRLATLAEYCIPFVRIGGLFIAYKSIDSDEEIKEAEYAVSLLGGKIERTEDLRLYGSDVQRRLVLIRKIKETPSKYPRGQNKPRKQPLLR